MMKISALYIFAIILTSGISSCENNFQSRDFPSVLTESVELNKEGNIVFKGKLISRGAPSVDELGFIWQSGKEPDMNQGFKANLANIVKSGPFELTVNTSIKKDIEYYVKAYAKTGDLVILGDTWVFSSPLDFQPPALSLNPKTGLAGDTVEISGGLFNKDISKNSISVNNLLAEIVKISDSSILCIVPISLEAKESAVKITSEGLTSVLTDKFSLNTPTLNSFTPAEAHFMDTVTITGSGFHRILSLNKVLFGGVNATLISSTPTSIKVLVPFTNETMCSISVSVSGQSVISQNKIKVISPDFDLFEPVSGNYLDTIIIHCKNLNAASISAVYMDNISSEIIGNNGSEIKVKVPGTLKKQNSNVKVVFSGNEYIFGYTFQLDQPMVSGISKDIWANYSNLTLYGVNFSPVSSTNKVILKNISGGTTYILTPNYSSGDSIKIIVYNHQNPSVLLPAGTYEIGIQTCESIVWSGKTATILNVWKRMSDFPGGSRYKCAAFSINGKGYAGMGTKIGNDIQKDLWEYNPDNDTWSRVADFPGSPRIMPCVFVNNDAGYVGGGQSIDNTASQVPFTDFYKYSPATNSWLKINDAPSVEKSYPGAFASPNGDVHVANLSTGIINEYNSSTNTWSETYSGMAATNRQPQSFSINGKAYFVCGGNNQYTNGTTTQVWEYDYVSNTMTRKNDFPGLSRYGGFSFSIGNYGYIGCGVNYIFNGIIQYLTDVYRYNPANDSWTKIQDFPGGYKHVPVSFVIGNKAYILTGYNMSSLTQDVWEFSDPDNNVN